jgi:hypothetical protein
LLVLESCSCELMFSMAFSPQGDQINEALVAWSLSS